MHNDKVAFMSFPRPPGRLTTEEAAWYLGFSPHDIPVLVSHKLLKPLGSPPQNATRYFSGPDLEKARTNSKWLDRASFTLIRHWRKKNEGKWGYKLNSLARRAVPSGTFMVLQALRELADRAKYSFYYSPSLDVWTNGGKTLVGELDLICLVDGELILGEAKSGRPKRAEFERFQARMLELRPDRVIVFVSQEFVEEARPLYESLRMEAEKHLIVPELFSLPSY